MSVKSKIDTVSLYTNCKIFENTEVKKIVNDMLKDDTKPEPYFNEIIEAISNVKDIDVELNKASNESLYNDLIISVFDAFSNNQGIIKVDDIPKMIDIFDTNAVTDESNNIADIIEIMNIKEHFRIDNSINDSDNKDLIEIKKLSELVFAHWNGKLETSFNRLKDKDKLLAYDFKVKHNNFINSCLATIAYFKYIVKDSTDRGFKIVTNMASNAVNYYEGIIEDFMDYENSFIKNSFNSKEIHTQDLLYNEFEKNGILKDDKEHKWLDQLMMLLTNSNDSINYVLSMLDGFAYNDDELKDMVNNHLLVGSSYSKNNILYFGIKCTFDKDNIAKTIKWQYIIYENHSSDNNVNNIKLLYVIATKDFIEALKMFYASMTIFDVTAIRKSQILGIDDYIKCIDEAIGNEYKDKLKFMERIYKFLLNAKEI